MREPWMTVGLPGVLARAEEQFAPLLGRYTLPDTRAMVDYHGKIFDFRSAVMDASDAVWEALDAYVDRVCIVGASLGADLVPFVMEERQLRLDPDRLKIILFDPPAGLDTMCDPMAKYVFGNRFVASTVVGAAKLSRMHFPVLGNMLPKPENISGPDKDQVVETARRNLTGHLASMFASQTAWMVRAERDGSLERAFRGLTGLDVTIVACTGPQNNVVRQPLAIERIMKWCPTAKRVDVPRGHCAFLENKRVFRSVTADIMQG